MSIKPTNTIPERMEKHSPKNWVDLSFDHKTTTTMGLLTPMAVKEVFPGEVVKLRSEVLMRFAPLFLPIMHQCYFTWDWFYVRTASLFQGNGNRNKFELFIMQHPVTGSESWAWFNYTRTNAVSTKCIMNYFGFNAPPTAGTLISQTKISAIPAAAYYFIWNWHYRNANIQPDVTTYLENGNNDTEIGTMFPTNLDCFRRNWPRDYYTIATPEPQFGANVLIPSYAVNPVTGDYVPQRLYHIDGTDASVANISGGNNPPYSGTTLQVSGDGPVVLEMSSTIRDFRYAAQMTEFLERATRAGSSSGNNDPNWNDFVKRFFGWNPNPLYIGAPVWIGGTTGQVQITDVMSTADTATAVIGAYTGKALVRDNVPQFTYKCPDYGVIIPIMTVYPKASYYSGSDKIWIRDTKMSYLWEQFALIGDQPMKNREVWFSWYDADIDWNDEIFGYTQQYNDFRYSNDIVSGQMRTLWDSFHLGRKFAGAGDVVLNSDFITCTPDIGRVFDVDAESGEHEIYVHAYVGIEVLRGLPKFALPEL